MAAAAAAAAADAGGAPAGPPPGVVAVPADVLRALRPSDVFVVRAPLQGFIGGGGAAFDAAGGSGTLQALVAAGRATAPAAAEALAPPRFFFHADARTPVACCAACGRFFHTEDLEMELLTRGGCPACRAPPDVVGV